MKLIKEAQKVKNIFWKFTNLLKYDQNYINSKTKNYTKLKRLDEVIKVAVKEVRTQKNDVCLKNLKSTNS